MLKTSQQLQNKTLQLIITITQNYTTPDDDHKYGQKCLGRRYGTTPLSPGSWHKKNNKTWKITIENYKQCSIVFNKTCVCVCVCVYIYISKVADHSRGWPEGSFFNSYYTKVLGRVLLLSPDCSTLPLIHTLWRWVLSKEVSSTIIFFFILWYDSTWDWTLVSPDHWWTL